MKISAREFVSDADFDVVGVSYAGAPVSHTAIFLTNKVAYLLEKLETVSSCLVFAEEGMAVSQTLRRHHAFAFCKSPQLDYARFAVRLDRERRREESKLRYRLTEGGYYISETAQVGENAYIEPGCLIGHHVKIGNDAQILAGSIIKYAIIGDDFLSNEGAVTGANGFNMAVDENGNKMRVPSLGGVRIGNHVEIGMNDNIERGSGGDTIIEDYVKIDQLICVGHDSHLGRNAELTAGAILGGFVNVGERGFVGLNAVIKNRTSVGEDALIGMGATVIRSVPAGTTVAGNPARPLREAKTTGRGLENNSSGGGQSNQISVPGLSLHSAFALCA